MTNPQKQIFLLLFISLISISSFAKEDVVVFDVRRNLALHGSDPVFRDFYINAGAESGIKEGMVITVIRRMVIQNPLLNKSQGEIEIPVAKIKVVFVQKKIAIARFHSLLSRQNLPVLDFPSVMTGDILDMQSAAVEVPKKEAQIEEEIRSNEIVKSDFPIVL